METSYELYAILFLMIQDFSLFLYISFINGTGIWSDLC